MQYLWNQSNVVAPEGKEEEADKCPICLDDVKKTNVSITSCGHKFCTSCLLSSLRTKNTCPSCRAIIEPEREYIEPISASTATEVIRDEERNIDLTRRIDVINSFAGRNGKSAMIFALCREFAFATAHGIASMQKTNDDTYHHSWTTFDSSDDEDEEQ